MLYPNMGLIEEACKFLYPLAFNLDLVYACVHVCM